MKIRKKMFLVIVMIVSFMSFGLTMGAYAQKTLVVGVEGDPPHLDHHLWTALLTVWVTDPINDFLVAYNEEMEIVPRIAEKWEFLDDVTFKFYLRKGVKFHNGREVTAEDVKNSIERILDPTQGSPKRVELEPISSVETIDRYTGIIHLKEPFAPLLDKLTDVAIVPVEVVKAQGDMKTNPVGCGPFKFKEWKKDAYIELEKFEGYWQKGLPKIDRLIFKPLPEYSAARAALLAGDIDILLWAKNFDIPAFKAYPNLYTVGQKLLGAYYIGFNVKQPPYDNPKVRQAIKYAIDKKACVKSAAFGYGNPAYVFILKGTPYYSSEFEYKQDIEKAKSLLVQAGYPDGFKDVLVTPLTPVEGPLGELAQSQLKNIGINLDVQKLEVATYIDRVFNKKDFGIMICGDTATGDPDVLLRRYFYSKSPRNIFNYKNPEVDRLLDKARTTYDFEKRKQLYKEVGKILIEDSPMIMLFQPMRFSACQNYVKGFVFKPNLRYEFKNVTLEK